MPRLTASFVKQTKTAGRFGDGRGAFGLALSVRPRAGGGVRKAWAQRIKINGQTTNLGLGGYPLVTLAEAREKALANARAVARGEDPRSPDIPTFAEAAEEVMAAHAEGWREQGRTEKKWRTSLEQYAYPAVGRKKVSEITSGDLLGVLAPIWLSKPSAARKVHQRIGAIMKWAIAKNYRIDNPAGEALTAALPRQTGPTQHQRAVHHNEVAGVIAAVQASDAHWATKACFEFQTLTAVRPNEARGMCWSELDMAERVWTIPGSRTKTGRPHRVPLSGRAMEMLDEAAAMADKSGLVFPSVTGLVMSDSTVSVLLRRLGTAAVPHGSRSSFRDWCSETGVPRDVAEACLAHVVGGVEGAYARSDLLERRVGVMEAWARHIKILTDGVTNGVE